jgi:F-type H+-transporting ATPase subunit delta
MSAESRVQSYVTAFFEAAFERWVGGLEAVTVALAADPALFRRLQNPAVEFAERQRLLDGVVPSEADASVRNLLCVMMQHDDLGAIVEVVEGLRRRMSQAAEGPVPVEVVSAIALTETQRKELESKLIIQYGAALDFTYRVDPAILGGMIVRVGDKLIDGSVASRLAAMKQSLGVSAA